MIINKIKLAYNKVAEQLVTEWGDRNAIYHDRLDFFSSCLMPGDKILDVGCGFGRDVVYFSEKGFISKGIDISTGMINAGKAKYGDIDIVQYDLFSFMETCTQKFLGIWVRGVLFHYDISEINNFVVGVKGIMEVGALIYVQSSNKEGLYTKNISVTSEALNYCYHSKADYINVFTKNKFYLLYDISTDKDICLIFKYGCIKERE